MKLFSEVAQQHLRKKGRGILAYRDIYQAVNLQQTTAAARNS